MSIGPLLYGIQRGFYRDEGIDLVYVSLRADLGIKALLSGDIDYSYSTGTIIGGALIAILGLGMGMWGLHSKRRGWALFGMLICVAAISLASYSGAMLIYELRQQAKEFEGMLE